MKIVHERRIEIGSELLTAGNLADLFDGVPDEAAVNFSDIVRADTRTLGMTVTWSEG